MSANSSSSLSIFSSHCAGTSVGRSALTIISCTYSLVVLPLSSFVLYLGVQRWSRRRSAFITHSDFFTYNMAVVELLGALGYLLYYCSSYDDLPLMMSLSLVLVLFTWPAQTLFPILTCVDQYLAVVYPITYRGLRQAGGVRIRNITTGIIFVMCSVWMAAVLLLNVQPYHRYTVIACILALSLIVMLFCSLSVLRVLIHRVGRTGKLVDKSKRRAVRTMLIITAVLWLKFGGSVTSTMIRFLPDRILKCVAEALTFVYFLPNGVVLPLLFLHRAGKLPVGKHSTRSGQGSEV